MVRGFCYGPDGGLMRFISIVIMAAVLLAGPPARAATTSADARTRYAAEVCRLLEDNAARHGLSLNFFTRLIWRESMFSRTAVSPVGAQGIAQFMPETARLRGLADPFDHRQALPAAALYLKDLIDKFGNPGIAAAAYNAGEDGAARWLRGSGGLPQETEDYVLSITGHSAAEWKNPEAILDLPGIGVSGPFQDGCKRLVLREMAPPGFGGGLVRARLKPWGVVVAGSFNERQALSTFARAKQRHADLIKNELPMVVRTRNLSRGSKRLVRVMIGRNSRAEAESLCSRIQTDGGACVVAKN